MRNQTLLLKWYPLITDQCHCLISYYFMGEHFPENQLNTTANFKKTTVISSPVCGHFDPALGVFPARLVRACCSKQHHTVSSCTTWRLGGSTGRSHLGYLIHRAMDSIWVADGELTFNLHHNSASRNFFPAKMPLLRCHQQRPLSNGDHRAWGRQRTERSSVPCRHAYWHSSHAWRGKADCELLSYYPVNHFYFHGLTPFPLLSNWCCNMVTPQKSVSR